MVDLTTDVPLEYRNRLANEVITISSLLDGFSIAIIAKPTAAAREAVARLTQRKTDLEAAWVKLK